MNTLYHEQTNDVEDIVLDNYVALFRHAIGDKRIFIRGKPFPTKPPELKELWRKELRTCQLCNLVKFYPRHYAQKYCGDRIKKEGCAHIKGMEGVKRACDVRLKNKAEEFKKHLKIFNK